MLVNLCTVHGFFNLFLLLGSLSGAILWSLPLRNRLGSIDAINRLGNRDAINRLDSLVAALNLHRSFSFLNICSSALSHEDSYSNFFIGVRIGLLLLQFSDLFVLAIKNHLVLALHLFDKNRLGNRDAINRLGNRDAINRLDSLVASLNLHRSFIILNI